MAIRWQTQSNLGVVANGDAISTTITAVSNVTNANLGYTIIAGNIPSGLDASNISNTLVISGTAGRSPATANINFIVRAYESNANVTLSSADRSFYYYWIGNTSPIISNATLPNATIGEYYQYQLSVNNDATNVTWVLSNSIINSNLALESNGIVRGYLSPTNENYIYFTVEAKNTIGSNVATYELPVSIDANANATGYRPFITTDSTVIASQRRNTYLYEVIKSYDYNGNTVVFNFNGNIPEGISVSNISNTFVISGLIANIGTGTQDFNFTLIPTKNYIDGNTIITKNGDPKNFTITVLGKIEDTPIWETDSYLGILQNGDISELSVKVFSKSNMEFYYYLSSESNLPNGLELKSDGTIVGKTQYNMSEEESFTVEFKVVASSIREIKTKTFSITIMQRIGKPVRNLYCRVMPKKQQREIYDNIINNSDIMPFQDLYRPLDPWFGLNYHRRFLFAAGLSAKDISIYYNAIEKNHYWKNVRFGEIKTAKAVNNNLETIYEIVYAELIDDSSVSGDSDLSVSASNGNITIYPNSFENMLSRIETSIGYENKGIIPKWMLSRQENGVIPGFKRVFPIAYTKPNKGKEIVYRIKEYQPLLNLIEFTIDRYESDSLSTNYPEPIDISGNANNIINVNTIVGSSSYTHLILNKNETYSNIVFFDGMKVKFNRFTTPSNYKSNTFLVSGVNSSIVLTSIDYQTISANISSANITGNNTFFLSQIHINDDILVNGNIIGNVKNIISNTLIELNGNSLTNVSNVAYTHTKWVSSDLPIDGDKYIKFPMIKVI